MLYELLRDHFKDKQTGQPIIALYTQTPRDAHPPYIELHTLETVQGTLAQATLIKARLKIVSRYTGESEIVALIKQLQQLLESNSFTTETKEGSARIQTVDLRLLADGITRIAEMAVHFLFHSRQTP